MLSPSFARQKVPGSKPRFVNGAAVYPTIETLPGLIYVYEEHVPGNTVAEDTFREHWCYCEHRGKRLTEIVSSEGWKDWMHNFQPRVCEPVAYHVALVKARWLKLQAEKSELDEIRQDKHAAA